MSIKEVIFMTAMKIYIYFESKECSSNIYMLHHGIAQTICCLLMYLELKGA